MKILSTAEFAFFQTLNEEEQAEFNAAFHEAGHAIAAYLLKIKFEKACVGSEGNHILNQDGFSASHMNLVVLCLAGWAAEVVFHGRDIDIFTPNMGYEGDIEIIKSITNRGDYKSLIRHLQGSTKEMIEFHMPQLREVAFSLYIRKELTYLQVAEIMGIN